MEDYLKAIYKLQGDESVSTTDLATELCVSAASVTNMVKRLADMQMVEHQSYRGVQLTDAGRKVALETIRHHRLLETYLRQVMGFSWAEMHAEAEHLEHHISESFERRIDEMLGYPTHDPHGHPIPTRDLEIADSSAVSLAEVPADTEVAVVYVSDGDPKRLTYLEAIDLLPGTVFRIVEKAPFNGPLLLRINGEPQTVGYEIATHVFVSHEAD